MNITNIKNCFGCGVCAASCGKRLIEIQQNNDGFYEPVITSPQLCTDCGLCVDVCAFSHDDYALKKHTVNSYGAWSKEYVVRRKCSSGGVAFEVGRYLLEQGYQALEANTSKVIQ
jgi:coenzyme F420-reducing hydrogenase beta subunit